MKKSAWNTYAIRGYSHQVGSDPRATGGVHLYQVKRLGGGTWVSRAVDSNGRFQSAGPVTPIPADEGEAKFEQALRR